MSSVKFSGLPGGTLTPAHTSCWNGFRDLFFVDFTRCGRRLPDVSGEDGKPITGPWRYKEYRKNTKCTLTTYQHVTLNVVAMHLSGKLTHGSQKVWLQCYAVSIEGEAVFTTVDLDVQGEHHSAADEHYSTQAEALEAALKLIAVVAAMGLTAHLELTKSGGYRVWVFHHKIKAAHARDLGKLMIVRAGLHSKTEIFPAQAYLNEGQMGSAVFCPYNHHNARHGKQVMVDPITGDVQMVDEFVAQALAHRSDPARVAEIVEQALAQGEIKPQAPRKRVEYDGDSPLADRSERSSAAWYYTYMRCPALEKIIDDCDNSIQLSYADWLRLATHLKPYGEKGREEFHELSGTDARYSEARTDAMFDSVSAPTRCEKMGCSRDPQGDCGLPENKVSPVAFAYDFLRQVPVIARPLRR